MRFYLTYESLQESWHLGQQHKAIECALSGDSKCQKMRVILRLKEHSL
jgi:hypothetical protein